MPTHKPVKEIDEIPADSIEIVDKKNKPLAIINILDVHRQALMHRSVIVLAYSPEEKIFLQKRSPKKRLYPGRWDVSASGHVCNNKSYEETAIEKIYLTLGIRADKLREIAYFEASPQTGNEFLTVYAIDKMTSPLKSSSNDAVTGYFYSQSELEWLMLEFRELLAPSLVFLNDQGLLFK